MGPMAKRFRWNNKRGTNANFKNLLPVVDIALSHAVVCSVERKGWWRGSERNHSFPMLTTTLHAWGARWAGLDDVSIGLLSYIYTQWVYTQHMLSDYCWPVLGQSWPHFLMIFHQFKNSINCDDYSNQLMAHFFRNVMCRYEKSIDHANFLKCLVQLMDLLHSSV
jgi:hypothetical protein